MDGIEILIGLIVNTGIRCIMGAISKVVNEKNGYYGGFAWGFWLGIIGIVIVAVRQPPFHQSTESIIIPERGEKLPASAVAEEDIPNSWQCRCGRYNAQYVSSCVCGVSKREALSPETEETANQDDEMKKISALKEYKQLLDNGVITQEEFESGKTLFQS